MKKSTVYGLFIHTLILTDDVIHAVRKNSCMGCSSTLHALTIHTVFVHTSFNSSANGVRSHFPKDYGVHQPYIQWAMGSRHALHFCRVFLYFSCWIAATLCISAGCSSTFSLASSHNHFRSICLLRQSFCMCPLFRQKWHLFLDFLMGRLVTVLTCWASFKLGSPFVGASPFVFFTFSLLTVVVGFLPSLQSPSGLVLWEDSSPLSWPVFLSMGFTDCFFISERPSSSSEVVIVSSVFNFSCWFGNHDVSPCSRITSFSSLLNYLSSHLSFTLFTQFIFLFTLPFPYSNRIQV